MRPVMLRTEGLAKSFTLHLRGGVRIPVLADVGLTVHAGECVVLSGPSGAGKTTLMRSLYGNYRSEGGHILIRHRGEMIDIASADPRTILAVRRETLGYVSQFLRVVPRVRRSMWWRRYWRHTASSRTSRDGVLPDCCCG